MALQAFKGRLTYRNFSIVASNMKYVNTIIGYRTMASSRLSLQFMPFPPEVFRHLTLVDGALQADLCAGLRPFGTRYLGDWVRADIQTIGKEPRLGAAGRN